MHLVQSGIFNNRLYFFQTFLSYLYLLSFVLHEAFLWDSATIEPVRIFLQVIGLPGWSLPEMYVSPELQLETVKSAGDLDLVRDLGGRAWKRAGVLASFV